MDGVSGGRRTSWRCGTVSRYTSKGGGRLQSVVVQRVIMSTVAPSALAVGHGQSDGDDGRMWQMRQRRTSAGCFVVVLGDG